MGDLAFDEWSKKKEADRARTQCLTGCCVDGICADSSRCWGDASPQVAFTHSAGAVNVSRTSNDPEFPFRIEFQSANTFVNYYADVGDADALGRVSGKDLSMAFGGGRFPVAGALVAQPAGRLKRQGLFRPAASP